MATIINLNDATPAALTGRLNVKWLADASSPVRNVSASLPNIGGVDPRTTTTETIGLASQGKLVTLSNAGAIAGTLDSTAGNGYFVTISVIGAGTATLTPSTGNINGVASLAVNTGQSCTLFLDGTNWFSVFILSAAANPYDIAIPLVGKMDPASTYLIITFTRPVTLPGNLVGSQGKVLTNPTATTTYSLAKNGATFGTVVISTSGAFTFTTTSGAAVTFAAGDYLTLLSPTPDLTLSDFEVTLAGTR